MHFSDASEDAIIGDSGDGISRTRERVFILFFSAVFSIARGSNYWEAQDPVVEIHRVRETAVEVERETFRKRDKRVLRGANAR